MGEVGGEGKVEGEVIYCHARSYCTGWVSKCSPSQWTDGHRIPCGSTLELFSSRFYPVERSAILGWSWEISGSIDMTPARILDYKS